MTEHKLLEQINCIDDFKSMPKETYAELAGEIRGFMVECVSKNGGHLASSLGVVELTMALHKVFDSPKDKLIFDVGHQGYVHKLLTGRYSGFKKLRKRGGVSGFLKREESEHDAFNAGHASTSISAALGMLRANKLMGREGHVVAVIGDGSLTGGMAFEALDDAGRSKLPLIVVINDNEMAISGNVGAMYRHLSRIRSSKRYLLFKRRTQSNLLKTKLGSLIAPKLLKLKNRIKYFILPNNILFEALGFTYLGPVDGHDMDELVEVFNRVKNFRYPVVVHVLTKKGKGYDHAENNPEKFHGIGAFDIETGETPKATKLSNSKVFGDTVTALAKEREDICAITAAMPTGTGLSEFAKKFPERFFDVGIAEQHAVTMAAGMAASGMRPIVAIYSTFMQRCYDQILHDVCLQRLPVLLAIDRAGLVGEDGETHHGINDIAYLAHAPNMTIYSPSTQNELRSMLRDAVRRDMPCAIRYNRGSLPEGDDGESPIEYGKWVVEKSPEQVTVIATGRLVHRALQIALELKAEGREIGVINARFIKPMDRELLDSLKGRVKTVVTVEDGTVVNGFGAMVSSYYSCSGIGVLTKGIPDRIIPQASIAEQDVECGLDVGSLKKMLTEVMDETAGRC